MARKSKQDDIRYDNEDALILDDDPELFVYEDEAEAEELEAYEPKKRKPKKTLKQKFGYKGKYDLLPEKENHKQIKFYQKLFNYRYAALIGGIVAMLFAYATIRFNSLFSVVVIFSVLPGLLYGILGLLKLRDWRFFMAASGIVVNVIAVIMVIGPFTAVVGSFGQIWQLLSDYFITFGI